MLEKNTVLLKPKVSIRKIELEFFDGAECIIRDMQARSNGDVEVSPSLGMTNSIQ
jgi:hypothetical protein